MSIITLVNQARQLLEILAELEQGNAYDLYQLGEHIGTKNKTELHEVAQILKDQGCVEMIQGQDDGGSPMVALALRSLDFDPGLVVRPKKFETPETGGIVNATVDLTAGTLETPREPSPEVERQPSQPQQQTPKVAPAEDSAIGELTIEQILLQLADAVEQSDVIDPPTKYPLLEKIKAVAGHPAIGSWLKTPLRIIVST